MNQDLMNSIIKAIESSTSKQSQYAVFGDKEYESIKIDKRNFHQIPNLKNNNKIAFIDGGNAEIFAASNLSLQLIRVYYTVYKSNKRVSFKKKEFYILIKSNANEKRIYYNIEIFGDSNLGKLNFDSEDETLKQGINRANYYSGSKCKRKEHCRRNTFGCCRLWGILCNR